jgi:hypothetical protein
MLPKNKLPSKEGFSSKSVSNVELKTI